MAAGVLSNELVDALPGVANITLRSFSTSNKVKYRKMGDYRVFLGPIDRIQTAGDKLLKVSEMKCCNPWKFPNFAWLFQFTICVQLLPTLWSSSILATMDLWALSRKGYQTSKST